MPEGGAARRCGDRARCSSHHRTVDSDCPRVLRHLEPPALPARRACTRSMATAGRSSVSSTARCWRIPRGAGPPTPWPGWAQSEDCLVASAGLLRELHDASRSFVPPDDAVWRQHAFRCWVRRDRVSRRHRAAQHRATAGYRLRSSTGTRSDRTIRSWSSATRRGILCRLGTTRTSKRVASQIDPISHTGSHGSHVSTASRSRRSVVDTAPVEARSVEAAKYWPISPAEVPPCSGRSQLTSRLHADVECLVSELN